MRREIVTLPSLQVPKATEIFDPTRPTIFHQDWWLSAASGGAYREAIVRSDGRIIGRLPFVTRKVMGVGVMCGMPELTPFLGPAIDEGLGSPSNTGLKRMYLTRELLAQLPNSASFYQKMHAGVSDMLVFQEQYYDISVQFTHEIAPAPSEALWSSMRDKTRNVIRRARETIEISDDVDPVRFVAHYNENLKKRKQTNTYTDTIMIKLLTESLQRSQGKIIAAINHDGDLIAAIAYVWDSLRSYYVLSTRSIESGNGAVSLLLWTAIIDSTKRGLIFDFDGVGTSGSILFFAGFGGIIKPRYIAYSYKFLYRTAKAFWKPFRQRGPQDFF